MTSPVASWIDLPDDQLMLVLCVREENLDNPALWCEEMRALARLGLEAPKTVAEADAYAALSEKLYDQAAGIKS
jgi:hypothetical protein